MIEIQGKQLLINLIVFEMLDFNMILEMDFLEKNEVEIDCQCKKIWFSLED